MGETLGRDDIPGNIFDRGIELVRLVSLYSAQLSGFLFEVGVLDGSADPHGRERANYDPCGDDADYPPQHRDSVTGSTAPN
jgi:hypothetical protein